MSDVLDTTPNVADPAVDAFEATRAATRAAAGVVAGPPRHRYRLRIAIAGRVRFLSHLETVDTLLSAIRRAGVTMQLSAGMKPKPLIKVAMPRPVAVEAWNDVVEVELTEAVDPDQLALSLVGTLPDGLQLQGIDAFAEGDTSAASRVAGATFRAIFDPADVELADLERWVAEFVARDEILVARVTPKQRKTVDVRHVVGEITAVDSGATESGSPQRDLWTSTAWSTPGGPAVRWFARLGESGSAKPEEILRAIATIAGREVLKPRRIVRESITFADPGSGHVAEPAMVGADVPDGPEKPWGAC